MPSGTWQEESQGILTAVNILIWSYSGYDLIGLMAEELKNTRKNFVKAVLVILTLAASTYFFTLIVSLGEVSTAEQNDWQPGYFAVVAFKVGGKPLQYAMIVSSVVSSLGMFNVHLFDTAQEARAMAKRELLGVRFLRWKHPKFRAPWGSLVLSGVLISCLTFFDFTRLIYLQNCLYAFIVAGEYISLITLRFKYPNAERPFKIGNNAVAILVSIPPSKLFSLSLCSPCKCCCACSSLLALPITSQFNSRLRSASLS